MARTWTETFASLSRADAAPRSPLGAAQLERLATAAFMLDRPDDHLRALERAHHAHLDAGRPTAAARCAVWLAIFRASRGQLGQTSGWLARARRLLADAPPDCAERGWLLLPEVIRQASAGDAAAAEATAARAAAIGERCGDPDLFALAVHEQGLALARQGRVGEGLDLLDEAMLAVTAGELSPIVTGLLYCSVIDGCQELFELRRAQEWTTALTRWCEGQPGLVSFTGRCLVHRAELLQLHGAWRDALAEARAARDRFARSGDERAAASAWYREGELHRLRGAYGAAHAAFRAALGLGLDPQPGLALLRLAEGDAAAAAAAIRRAIGETGAPLRGGSRPSAGRGTGETGAALRRRSRQSAGRATGAPLRRARLLPAAVEILLAVGDLDAAQDAGAELARVAAGNEQSVLLRALADHGRGAVALRGGDAHVACPSLRRAGELWQRLEAPYEHARTRVLLAGACRALGDAESAALELEAARAAFARLGAAPDLAAADGLAGVQAGSHRLTRRELEVLRQVASGRTNKAIAADLVLSERTVDRHLSNILAKLGCSSRTAATAYAYEHELL